MDNYNEGDESLLVVVLDTNPLIWGKRVKGNQTTTNGNAGIDFSTLLEHMCVFINAFLMLRHQNQIAIIANHVGESKFLYPRSAARNLKDTHDNIESNEFAQIQNQILEDLRALANSTPSDASNNHSTFSGSLSLGLCYINRILKERTGIKPRILVFQVSPDVSSQYVAVMNCIFSAQKQYVPVDSCILGSQESTFLQQASHLTGGIYLKPLHQEGLLQYLLSCFVADVHTRKALNLPTLTKIDYRASCFCHKTVVDMGFVCSVCLSIFCQFRPICSTCGAKFALPKVQKPPAKKVAPPVKKS